MLVKENQGKCNSRLSPSLNAQVTTGDGFEDRQFVVLTSEKQARVVALPSQDCVYRQQLAETHIVIKAEVTTLKGNKNFSLGLLLVGIEFYSMKHHGVVF